MWPVRYLYRILMIESYEEYSKIGMIMDRIKWILICGWSKEKLK